MDEKLKYNRQRRIMFAVLIVLTLVRIALMLRMPLYAVGNSQYDDYLLAKYADSLANFQWLGPYTNTTLVKGISFSIFLALCQMLAIPYPLGLILLYIFSIIIFLRAIEKLVPGFRARAIIYVFLLYSPAMFHFTYVQRIYRMAVVPPAVLLVIGCIIGLYQSRYEKNRTLIAWALGAGLSISFFWYIREDSVWLMPFIAGAVLITGICLLIRYRGQWRKLLLKLVILSLPFFCLYGVKSFISFMNYEHYGIYTVSDRTQGGFAEFISNLLKVDGDNEREDVWISREMLNKVMEVSPTLNELREEMNYEYDVVWGVDGEIQGDLIFWALREAADIKGCYEQAKTADEFFARAAREIGAAFEDGRLQKKQAFYVSALGKGLLPKDIPELVKRTLAGLDVVLDYEAMGAKMPTDEDPEGTFHEQMRFLEATTGSLVVYRDNDPLVEKTKGIIWLSNKVIQGYQATAHLLLIIAGIGAITLTISMLNRLRKKDGSLVPVWFILTGCLICILALAVGIAWFTAWMGSDTSARVFYMAGAIPMIQVVEILAIYTFYQLLKDKLRRKPYDTAKRELHE